MRPNWLNATTKFHFRNLSLFFQYKKLKINTVAAFGKIRPIDRAYFPLYNPYEERVILKVL